MKRRTIGISFCQVDRTRHIGHEIEAITWGNQKWKGAIPAFRARPLMMNRTGKWPAEIIGRERAPVRKIIDPVA